MLDIVINGLNQLQSKLAGMQAALNDALAMKAQMLAQTLVQTIRDYKLSGQVLQERTGRLKDSINNEVEENENGPSATVFVSGDVPYAAIQEYGGNTKAHVIEATNGKALAFAWQGKAAFFAHVNHPGSVIPEHSYLRSAFSEMQDDIIAGLADAVGEAMEA